MQVINNKSEKNSPIEVTNEKFCEDLIKYMNSNICNDSDHKVCKTASKRITDAIDLGYQLSKQLLEAFVVLITRTESRRYTYYNGHIYGKCVDENHYVNALNALIIFYCPSVATLDLLIEGGCDKIIETIINVGHEIRSVTLTKAIEVKNAKISDMLSKYTNTTVVNEHLDDAVKNDLENTVANLLARKMQPKSKTLFNAMSNKDINIAHAVISCGVIPTELHLEEACLRRNMTMVKFLLDLKITPTKKCFANFITTCKNDENRSKYRWYRNNNDEEPQMSNGDRVKFIDILISYGYKIDYDDVLEAMKAKIAINNITHYGIVFDGKYMELCTELNYYPYPEIDKTLNHSIASLEKACSRSGNLQTIKKIISSGVNPNEQCLINACTIRNNSAVIKFLVSKKAPVTVQCLKTLSISIGNSSMSFLLDSYCETEKIAIMPLEDNDNDNDIDYDNDNDEIEEKIIAATIADTSIKLPVPVPVPAPAPAPVPVPVLAAKKVIKKKVVKGKKAAIKDENSDDEKIEVPVPVPVVVPKPEPKPEPKPATEPEKIKVYDTIVVPKPGQHINDKKLLALGPKLHAMFKVKNMTFIKLKAEIYQYMTENNLVDHNDKMMIKLDKKLAEIAGIEDQEGKYLKYVDYYCFACNVYLNNQ